MLSLLVKAIKMIWSMRVEFAKYFTIGISAFVLDVGSLYILKTHLGLNPTVAIILNQPIILLFVFYLNKHWSFGSAGLTKRQMRRFLTVAFGNYLISIAWMSLFNGKMGFPAVYVRTANIATAVAWNFLLYKFWVYRQEKPQLSQNASVHNY